MKSTCTWIETCLIDRSTVAKTVASYCIQTEHMHRTCTYRTGSYRTFLYEISPKPQPSYARKPSEART